MIDPMLFSNDPAVWLKELLVGAGLGSSLSVFLSTVILVSVVIIPGWLSNFITRFIIGNLVPGIVKRTSYARDYIIPAKYEDILSEISEPLFAVLPGFGLRVFRQPSGFDLLTLSEKTQKTETINKLYYG